MSELKPEEGERGDAEGRKREKRKNSKEYNYLEIRTGDKFQMRKIKIKRATNLNQSEWYRLTLCFSLFLSLSLLRIHRPH